MAEVKSTFELRRGALAPDFRLPDAAGTLHDLHSLRGESGLLVVFACNHCPYVIHLAKKLGELAAEWKLQGVNTVAIASNDVEKYPQDGPDLMPGFAAESGWDFPYLFDETQEIAHAYSAACTPDFYLFDHELRLYYAGQFDDSRPKNGSIPTGADLSAAVADLLAGLESPQRTFPSSGCNIKWKPGNEPTYFAPVK